MMFAGRRIAVVEDDGLMGASIVQRLELEGARVTWLRLAGRALGELRMARHPIDAVVCDIRLPDGSGEELFRTLSETARPPPFLFITGQGSIDQAVRLMQSGATDYITKPFDMARFLSRLGQIMPARKSDGETIAVARFGVSEAARRIEARIASLAAGDDSVLIMGAGGTGKRFVARAIHDASERAFAPWREVNAAQSPALAAELRTAFEEAEQGTLFINALDHIEPAGQALLFDHLNHAGDVRVIAACRPDIGERIAAGRFGADLFYRIARSEIVLPPLSERPDDAVFLLNDLFRRLNAARPVPLRGLSALAEQAARAHDWPGNGRELRARLTGAMAAARGEWIQPVDLFPERQVEGSFATLADARDTAERAHIVAALDRAGGQINQAARLLGVSRTTLWEKMQKLGL